MNYQNEAMDQTGGGLMPEERSYTIPVTNHKVSGNRGRKTRSKIQEGKGMKRAKNHVSKRKATTKKTTRKATVPTKSKKTSKKACKPKKKVTRKTRKTKKCK